MNDEQKAVLDTIVEVCMSISQNKLGFVQGMDKMQQICVDGIETEYCHYLEMWEAEAKGGAK